MRTTIGVYKSLLKYIEIVDAEAVARGEGPNDKSVDAHFRSGVYLGNGMLNLVLSLMPGKLQTLVELLGYKGDRHVALELLALSGGWSVESAGPAVSIGKSCLAICIDYHADAHRRGGGRSSDCLRYLSPHISSGSIKLHV